MAAPKFTSDQRQHRRREVARMYLQGKYQHEIAAEFGVHQTQISYDLAVIRRAWRMSSIRDFDAVKTAELAKIDTMEREYWDAWEKSKLHSQRTTTKRIDAPIGGRTEAHVTKEDQHGDPRYLQGVERCIKQRSDLLGLNAPVKTETKIDLGTMPPDERRKRIDELVTKRGSGTTGTPDTGGSAAPPEAL